MTRVAVAMSGGVDSSVAAALAVEKYGQDHVFGMTMKLLDDTGAAIPDAIAVCKKIGIRHYVLDLGTEFQSEIICNFISEYEQGRTPNPCVLCNKKIKFGHLLDEAQKLGADLLVTGHYARISDDQLLRGLDPRKDQSYFLYSLTQDQLTHIWFPLGELAKSEVRKLAGKYGLSVAAKKDSQDICFVATTTQDFLVGKVKARPGNIVDGARKVLGEHEGLPFYTIGQRKGLGGGFTEPMYVVGLDVGKNELVVGKEEALYGDQMMVGDVSWTHKAPKLPVELDVKIRYNSDAAKAQITNNKLQITNKLENSKTQSKLETRNSKLNLFSIKFNVPQKAITPGQTAVFYDGDRVVGGGTILSTGQD